MSVFNWVATPLGPMTADLMPASEVRAAQRVPAKIFKVGETGYLPESDWTDKTYIALNDKLMVAWIANVFAKRKRQGSFRRLVSRLILDGYTVRVVTPILDMPAIMAWWGATPRVLRDRVSGLAVQYYELKALPSQVTEDEND